MTLEMDVDDAEVGPDKALLEGNRLAKRAYDDEDWKAYAQACNKYGIKPWDLEAYERGMADVTVARQKQADYVKSYVPKIKQGEMEYRPSTVDGLRGYLRKALRDNPDSRELADLSRGLSRDNISVLMKKANEVRRMAGLPQWEWERIGNFYCVKRRRVKR